MCRRTFEHSRRTYCGPFCRLMGSRVGGFRYLFHLEGEYRQARWWVRRGTDPRWIIGPPRMLLDVWQAPNGDLLCPDCGEVMTEPADATGLECIWHGIRVIPLGHG